MILDSTPVSVEVREYPVTPVLMQPACMNVPYKCSALNEKSSTLPVPSSVGIELSRPTSSSS